MLYISTDKRRYKWHVGEPKPVSYTEVAEILEIQADGDELAKIHRECSGIPMCTRARVVRWFGDEARFIVANLDYNPPKFTYPI